MTQKIHGWCSQKRTPLTSWQLIGGTVNTRHLPIGIKKDVFKKYDCDGTGYRAMKITKVALRYIEESEKKKVEASRLFDKLTKLSSEAGQIKYKIKSVNSTRQSYENILKDLISGDLDIDNAYSDNGSGGKRFR